MKCKGENVDDDEIASIVRVWSNTGKDGEFDKSYRNESNTITSPDELEYGRDTGYVAPYKRYGDDFEKSPADNKYIDGIIYHEKCSHKIYPSDNET